MVRMMAKKQRRKERQRGGIISLVLCEGETEYWYLRQLDRRKYKVSPSKGSNAQKLVKQADDEDDRLWKNIYCVFDHDSHSNPRDQLVQANKIIKESEGKLIRVFSKPCFEVALLCYFRKNSKPFDNAQSVVNELNKCLQESNLSSYDKTESFIKTKLFKNTSFEKSFKTVCQNSRSIYEKLKINETNWLDNSDAYSEIFKLDLV